MRMYSDNIVFNNVIDNTVDPADLMRNWPFNGLMLFSTQFAKQRLVHWPFIYL